MERFGCPPGCYPAILATIYYKMGWRWALTLTAPPGRLGEFWSAWWDAAGEWDRISPYTREPSEIPERLPFGVYGVPEMSYRFVPKRRWPELDLARAELDRLRPDAWSFWVATFAVGRNRVPHIHMAVGGEVGYRRMRRLVALWPGRVEPVKKMYAPWGWLHYMFAQRKKEAHRTDELSRCPDLLAPPVYSWNFEACLLAHRHRERMKRERKKRRRRLG